MLDKSIPYKNIIMRNEQIMQAEIRLPDGFSFRFFQEGDQIHWGRIETSVLEFDCEEDACSYFQETFMPFFHQLTERCVFVLNPEGLPVATATAWFMDSAAGHQAVLHWVSVCPQYQGIGLGRAVVQKAMQLYQKLESDEPIWLHTQTWSHVAIRLYASLGFRIAKTAKLASIHYLTKEMIYDQTEFSDAIEVLSGVMDSTVIEELVSQAF